MEKSRWRSQGQMKFILRVCRAVRAVCGRRVSLFRPLFPSSTSSSCTLLFRKPNTPSLSKHLVPGPSRLSDPTPPPSLALHTPCVGFWSSPKPAWSCLLGVCSPALGPWVQKGLLPCSAKGGGQEGERRRGGEKGDACVCVAG